jgi:thioredoxin-dependent peroxiredoxin
MSDEQMQAGRPVQVGDHAPDFSLPTQAGSTVSLKDFLGKAAVIVFFYPKDNTGGCTKEACGFRDSYEAFKEAGAEVIGVSSDSVASHSKFAHKHQLPFILASDPGGTLRKRYGVPATWGILPGRVTYIIDKQGIIRHISTSHFAPERHIEEALNALKALGAE